MITLLQGDITKVEVDAIVNAANTSLLGGGGVDGAIHRAGGPAILEACRAIRARQGGCDTGEAVYTSAGRLPAKWVLHTVGPVWQDGEHGEAELLKRCYLNTLNMALELQATSVAFPNISTGIYGFPKALAADIAIACTQNFMSLHSEPFKVVFVCFDHKNHQLYQNRL